MLPGIRGSVTGPRKARYFTPVARVIDRARPNRLSAKKKEVLENRLYLVTWYVPLLQSDVLAHTHRWLFGVVSETQGGNVWKRYSFWLSSSSKFVLRSMSRINAVLL
jgi:hypothetical protein